MTPLTLHPAEIAALPRKSRFTVVLDPQPPTAAILKRCGDFSWMNMLDTKGWHGWLWNSPYRNGDKLWVREAWRTASSHNDLKPSDMSSDEPIKYEVDDHIETWGWKDAANWWGRYRPPMSMPEWASRFTLTITDVKVQRVQEISERDAIAEGVTMVLEDSPDAAWFSGIHTETDLVGSMDGWHFNDARSAFADRFDTIHGEGSYARNPWVSAFEFTTERNET